MDSQALRSAEGGCGGGLAIRAGAGAGVDACDVDGVALLDGDD